MRVFEILNEFKIDVPQDLGKDRTQKLSRIVNKVSNEPQWIDKIFDTLALSYKEDEGFKDKIISMIDPSVRTDSEQDLLYAKSFLQNFATIIEKTEGTAEEKLQFANTLGKVDHIDVDSLTKPGLNSWSDWLTGSAFSQRVFYNIFNHPSFISSNKGPGEAALALLSPRIKLSPGRAGDLEIDGSDVEVKGGESSSGGRLDPTKNSIGNLYGDERFWSFLFPNDQAKAKELSTKTVTPLEFSGYVQDYNLTSDHIKKILSAVFKMADPSVIDQAAASGGQKNDIVKVAFSNYSNSQELENFLIIQLDVKKTMFFSVKNLDSIIDLLAVGGYVISKDTRSIGSIQIGLKKPRQPASSTKSKPRKVKKDQETSDKKTPAASTNSVDSQKAEQDLSKKIQDVSNPLHKAWKEIPSANKAEAQQIIIDELAKGTDDAKIADLLSDLAFESLIKNIKRLID